MFKFDGEGPGKWEHSFPQSLEIEYPLVCSNACLLEVPEIGRAHFQTNEISWFFVTARGNTILNLKHPKMSVCVCVGHRGLWKKFTVGLNCYSGPWTNCPSSAGDKFTLPSINRGNWESSWFQRSVLPTSLTYFALSTRGYRPWRPDDFSSWVKFLMARNKKCFPSFCGVNILAFAGSIPHLYCLFYPIFIHVASLTYPQTASSPVTAADRPPSCLWGWPPTPPANNRCANLLLHLQIMIYNQMNNLPSIKK